MFGDSFWPRRVGRTATKLSYVTQNSLHFIASRRDSRRHFECNFFKSPHYVPPGIRWEDPNGVGDGQQLYFLPGLTHFVSRKEIALLLSQLKFEKLTTSSLRAYTQAFGKLFFRCWLKCSLSRKLRNFSVRFSTAALF